MPAHLVDLVGGHADAGEEDVPQGFRHRPFDLEADRLAEAAAPELLLDREEEVVGLVLLEGQVGVAGHAEEVVLLDLHALEEQVQVGLDDLVQQDEPVVADRLTGDPLELQESGQDRRDLDPRESPDAGLGISQADGDRQGQGRDVREAMARVDREWRQDGVDLLDEPPSERRVVIRDFAVVEQLDPGATKVAAHVPIDRRVLLHELQHARSDRAQLGRGARTLRRDAGQSGPNLLAKAGNTDLEELVQVVREDRQEA